MPTVSLPWPSTIEPSGNYYTVPDLGRLPRVTAIIKATNGVWGEGLRSWYGAEERRAVLEAVKSQFGWAAGMTPEAFVALVESNLGPTRAALKKMAAAGDIGTEVHKAIQARLRSELGLPSLVPALSDAAALAFMAWEDWWSGAGFTPVAVEQVIWHNELRYAGTIDLIAEKAGQLWILDWKSANYIVLDHHIQVACYLEAAQRWNPVAGATIVRVPKSLDNIQIEVKPLGHLYNPSKRKEFRRNPEQLMESFRALRKLYDLFMEEHPDDGSA